MEYTANRGGGGRVVCTVNRGGRVECTVNRGGRVECTVNRGGGAGGMYC